MLAPPRWRSRLSALVHLARAVLSRDPFLGALEQPASGAVWAFLPISGWTLSRRAPVARVEAFLDDAPLGTLRYGVDRPDVADVFPRAGAARSGYERRIRLDPALSGRRTLIVRAVDRLGNIREYRRALRLQPPRPAGSPEAEIEQASWRGARLDVEGWAVWPLGTPPLTVRLLLDGRVIARDRLRSRPDIGRRFGDQPAAHRSGFRFAAIAPAAIGGPRASHTLEVELSDTAGQRIHWSTRVEPEPGGAAGAVDRDRIAGLERVLTAHRDRRGREPAVLDWSGAELATLWPGRLVFSPLDSRSGARLPYVDGSIDLVVIGAAERLPEARRVAASAVIVVDEGGVEEVPVATGEAAPSPSVSIVIPVHGQLAHTEACLDRLETTLPPGFRGEIIMVDDASPDGTPAALARRAARDRRIRVLTNATNLGFVASCNRAAREAIGDVLVFLNNDTLPEPGWLPPLLEVLRDVPDAGAVGAKLVYLNGRLQEAGGVVFADGSAANFGRDDPEPDDPLYNHRREVDYCSAATLATPRALFLEVGGFDPRYAPAYYEDTDYAFALREHGYRVYYQPASVVVHLEGGTAGTDPGEGVKRFQRVNREKFVARWGPALAHQPAPPARLDRAALHRLAVRGPGRAGGAEPQRALVWSPTLPEHDRESGSRRVYDTLRFLREAGWAVTFIARSATDGVRYLRTLAQIGIPAYAGEDSMWAGGEYLSDPTELIAHGRFDVAILHFWHLAEERLPLLRALSPATRIIVDSVDVHFLRQSRAREAGESGKVAGPLPSLETDATARELQVYTAADAVLAVSAEEAELINRLAGRPSLAHLMPDTEDLPVSPVPFGARRGILFVGNFRHRPNVEALGHLCRAVLPRLDPALLATHPVSVVGNGLTRSIAEQCGARARGVELVGWVPSLLPYLQRARVSVIPLLHGAGTKRKLVQALLAGTPSVSTSIGVEGLGLRDGEDVLVADEPEAFAAAIARLAREATLWEGLGARGRATALAAHGRDAVRGRLEAVLATVLSPASA